MNEEQLRIFSYLNENARGYENRRTSSDIRENCHLQAGDTTNVYVRNLIRGLILDHGVCIGSIMWRNGFWIIQNEEEVNMVCESLRQRADSIYERADTLQQNWQNRNNG